MLRCMTEKQFSTTTPHVVHSDTRNVLRTPPCTESGDIATRAYLGVLGETVGTALNRVINRDRCPSVIQTGWNESTHRAVYCVFFAKALHR